MANESNRALVFQAREYDEKIKMTLPYYEEFYQQVVDVVKNQFDQSLRWLDVGCGTGKMAESAYEHFDIEQFVFCDNSPEMLETARKRFSKKSAKFVTSSVQEMDLHKQFDVITAIQVLHYLNKEERKDVVRRCFEALKPGGIFISFENFAPNSKQGEELYLKRWRAYQIAQGKGVKEADEHISRYKKAYFPITIAEHMEVLKQGGFSASEIIWLSNMQVGVLGIASGGPLCL